MTRTLPQGSSCLCSHSIPWLLPFFFTKSIVFLFIVYFERVYCYILDCKPNASLRTIKYLVFFPILGWWVFKMSVLQSLNLFAQRKQFQNNISIHIIAFFPPVFFLLPFCLFLFFVFHSVYIWSVSVLPCKSIFSENLCPSSCFEKASRANQSQRGTLFHISGLLAQC